MWRRTYSEGELNTIRRIVLSLLMIAAGVALARDLGGVAGKLTIWILRNPLAIALTTFVSEYFPKSLLEFEQDCFVYLPLAPYIAVFGLAMGIFLDFRAARLGAWLPLSYAVWFTGELFRVSTRIEGLHWTDFIPHLVWYLCLTPIYLLSVAAGRAIAERRVPRYSLRDLIGWFAIFSIFAVCIASRPYLGIPSVLLVGLGVLAYRFWRSETIGSSPDVSVR